MNLEKSPGLDGFPTGFFQKCWSFIRKEVTGALEGMRNSGNILREINNTFLALIPKKEEPNYFDEFILIALCNTIYKIFTKTLANWLHKLLPLLISEEQMGFVPRRLI